VSRAKNDAGDARVLADMVRTDSHQLRPAAGDSPEAQAVKVLARVHKTTLKGPTDSTITTPPGGWPTGWSASCTDA
jgi:Transposase